MAAEDVDMIEEEERVSAEEEVAEEEEVEVDEEAEVDGGEEEEEVAEGEDNGGEAQDNSANSAGADVVTDSFGELRLEDAVITGAQEAWRVFINSAASREAAGEAIYAALFDAAPSLQSLFTTPRAIQAMKFMNGLNQFIMGLSDPAGLKVQVETLGFGHLVLDVTVPRVVIFRDAILDLFQVELGSKLTTEAYKGWRAMLNYVGGAIIFIKAFYADRIRLLGESWTLANDKGANKDKFATLGSQEGDEMGGGKMGGDTKKGGKDGEGKDGQEHNSGQKGGDSMLQNVPTTFKEMFQFNAAVMGFGQSMWMNEVLACFDNIVSNVSNSNRLVEECDVLVCRIAKVSTGKVNLAEFKSCMLASLRSLLPKDWTTQHEVAWSWLWENVERTLMKNMGQPPKWEKAYAKLLDSIDEATGFQLRKDIYLKFFALAPAGQDYFKQSNTYLHLIATKVLVMVVDIYRDPVRMVDDISALGLRHVGYAIPTEYMPPFASACVEVVQGLTKDQDCIDGFQWSIGLIAKSLVRTILEGSTIVMKAINQNTRKSMNKAISVAPRGERAQWMLLIQVGTQNISPLAWAIESGSVASASAMLNDLLTIRADRDKYYYASDDMFSRHPNIVQMLLNDAPALLPHLLDGLVWRSRVTQNGLRRVNYYARHLILDPDNKFHKTLEWVARAKDPKIVCHPILVMVSDKIWTGVATRTFLFRKSWFLFTLLVFIISQSVIEHLHAGEKTAIERYTMFCIRTFIYLFSMGQMMYQHSARIIKSYMKASTQTVKLFGVVRIPSYLDNWQEAANLFLMLCLMLMVSFEPILHCLEDNHGIMFTDVCKGSLKYKYFPYSVVSMFAMLLYYCLLIDLAVFNNRVSAYVLVCGRMIGELCLFLLILAFVMLAFASAFSCLDQKEKEFHGIQSGMMGLWEMVLGMFSGSHYEKLHDVPVILLGCFAFLVMSTIFLLNMLVAQLSCAYDAVYADMVGYARLKRIRIIVESMPQVTAKRWDWFVTKMEFEKRIEFNEGDVGLANGLATAEPANVHPTTVDQIKRFGGSTSPSIAWPEEENANDDSDKFDRLEILIKRTMERLTKSGGKKKGRGASSSGMSGSGSGGGEAATSGMSGEGEGGGDEEGSGHEED